MSALITMWMILAIAFILLAIGTRGKEMLRPMWKKVAISTGVMLFVVIGIAAITVPVARKKINNEILKFQISAEMVKATRIIEKRTGLKESLLDDIITKRNTWLSNKQEENKGFLDIWVPDEVDNLKPLK